MKFFSCFTATVAAVFVSAKTGIMLPLYEYPYGDAAIADWTAVLKTTRALPRLPFYIIINDNSGPPYSPNPPEAIKDFAPYLAVLNRRPNVKLIGYIATNYGLKSTSNVKVAVDQYAAWTKAEGWTAGTSYDIHMDGIFFDDIDTSPKQLAHNKAISKYAKTKFASQKGPVVLNPGTTVQSGSESLFDVSNAIMDIEACYTKSAGRPDFNGYACDPTADGYSQFTPATLNKLGTNLTRVGRSSVVVHDFYETWRPYNTATTTQLKTYVDAIVKKRVHSFYISQLGYTSNFTAKPASISNVAKLAALAQNLV